MSTNKISLQRGKDPKSPGPREEEKSALRKRVREFYKLLAAADFARCSTFLDPTLNARVDQEKYLLSLRQFLAHYGAVRIVSMVLQMHLGVELKGEVSDFAYPLIVWKDARHAAHLFQERWVKRGKTWYTRVVGYATPDAEPEETFVLASSEAGAA